jgi:hypothetical protein
MIGFDGKKISFLYLAGALFVWLVLMLGYYNRPAIDDYAYLLEEKTLGIRAATLNTYMTWDTRWVGFLLLNVFLKVYEKTNTLLWYQGFSLFSLIAALYFVISQVFKVYFIPVSSKTSLAYALLFAAGFFFLTFGIDETWFWINASVTYFWPFVFAFLGLGFMLKQTQQFKTNAFFCFLFFFLAGGASYEFAPVLLMGFSVFLIREGYKNSGNLKKFLNQELNRKIVIALLGCGAGFAINYFGPGNSVRQSAEPPESILHAFPVTAISFVKLMLLDIFPKIPYILFFSVPWIFLGHYLGKGKAKERKIKPGTVLAISAGLFVILVSISLFIPAYLLSEMGPRRSLTQIAVYLMSMCAILGVYFGYNQDLNPRAVALGFYISVIACIGILAGTIVSQQTLASNYSRALDQRIKHLKELNAKDNTAWVKLDPLPSSGFLYSAEISRDTAYFSNVQFQKSLSLNFKISLK